MDADADMPLAALAANQSPALVQTPRRASSSCSAGRTSTMYICSPVDANGRRVRILEEELVSSVLVSFNPEAADPTQAGQDVKYMNSSATWKL